MFIAALMMSVTCLSFSPPTGPVALFVQPVGAAPAVSEAGRIDADSSVDALLEVLNQRGQHLTDLDAVVRLVDTEADTGSDTVRTGRFLYHVRPSGVTALHVVFDSKAEGDKPAKKERIEYLLDGPWLTDRNYAKRKEVKRQVLKAGEKINLFRLGEGPFPLPIGQDPSDVKKQFTVTKLDSDSGDPRPKIRLVPRPGTRLAQKFTQIDVSVDPATHFPTRISTTDFNQTTQRTTELSGIRINPAGGITEAELELPKIEGDWQFVDEPFRD